MRIYLVPNELEHVILKNMIFSIANGYGRISHCFDCVKLGYDNTRFDFDSRPVDLA